MPDTVTTRFCRLAGFAMAASLAAVAPLASAGSFDLSALLGEAGEFTVLGLEGGTVTINSSTSITGDVGYGNGVQSLTNQKVDSFQGTAFVHSGATFQHTPATFAPSGGIQTGPQVDAKLQQANADALAASSSLGGLSALTEAQIEAALGNDAAQKLNLGAVGDNDDITLDTTGLVDVTVLDVSSWSYKEDTVSLIGDSEDVFVFNVSGGFNFSSSAILLSGIDASNVVFNFLTAAAINVNKATTNFNGVILAPTGAVDYHNPATFNGAILASDINLHSDFNVAGPGDQQDVPEPSSWALILVGLIFARGRRRSGC